MGNRFSGSIKFEEDSGSREGKSKRNKELENGARKLKPRVPLEGKKREKMERRWRKESWGQRKARGSNDSNGGHDAGDDGDHGN